MRRKYEEIRDYEEVEPIIPESDEDDRDDARIDVQVEEGWLTSDEPE